MEVSHFKNIIMKITLYIFKNGISLWCAYSDRISQFQVLPKNYFQINNYTMEHSYQSSEWRFSNMMPVVRNLFGGSVGQLGLFYGSDLQFFPAVDWFLIHVPGFLCTFTMRFKLASQEA